MASNLSELITLCKTFPNQKINGIHVDGYFGGRNAGNFQEPESLDNIVNGEFWLKNVNENDLGGWICDANWKNLKTLFIKESFVLPPYNLITNYFANAKWYPNFPQLGKVTIYLRKIPFHYCSLISLLAKSPHLKDMEIELEPENSIIQDFDAINFTFEMKKRQLKLEIVKMVNKYQPIIPFESFMDLIHASPNIKKVTGNFNTYEELLLKREYTVCFEDDGWNLDDFPILSMHINQ